MPPGSTKGSKKSGINRVKTCPYLGSNPGSSCQKSLMPNDSMINYA